MGGWYIQTLALCVVGVLLLFGLSVLIWRVTRRRGESERPYCGNCEYDLTGSESNRCPECGKLFIDAGVHRHRAERRDRRLLRWSVPAALVMLVLIVGGGSMLIFIARAQQQQAAANAARAQAMAAFMQASLAKTKEAEAAAKNEVLNQLMSRLTPASSPASRQTGSQTGGK